MLEKLQIINFIITIATGGFALLLAVSKPFRNRLFNIKTGQKNEQKENKENNERSRETDRCLLRDRITTIYYDHYHEKKMKIYEFDNVNLLYEHYKELKGNSFADKIWKEMQEWQIVP
jgi:hypothetical protein